MGPKVRSQRHKVLVLWLLGMVVVVLLCTVVGLIVLRQSRAVKQSVQRVPPVPAKSLHLVHPVFGEARETIGVDEAPRDVGRLSVAEQTLVRLGLQAPPSPPPAPGRTNLLVGQTPMWWSAGGNAEGYVYCDLLSSNQVQLLWQFAPCDKTNLIDVMPQDFLTTFVSQGDMTNGLAAFGTNWLKHGIRVHQGQIILARLASDPGQVYALEFAEQSISNAVVYYLKKPL